MAKRATKFTWLTGDVNWLEHGGCWISDRKVADTGNWGYYVREIYYREEIMNEYEQQVHTWELQVDFEKSKPVRERKTIYKPLPPHKYEVTVTWVSPPLLSAEEIKGILSSISDEKPWAECSEVEQVEMLYMYYRAHRLFCCGCLHRCTGNSYKTLFREISLYV